jgi:hypothetical protein
MNTDDLVRSGLHDLADEAIYSPDLYRVVVQRGRRRQTVRRATAASGAILTVAAVAGVGVVVADNTGGGSSQKVVPADDQDQAAPQPWWQTWTTDRYDGGIDQAFLTAARPIYDPASTPEDISVYAAGTTPDGSQWVMFTDPHDGHVMQWVQGWDDAPDFGESTGPATPDITWTSWTTPTLAAHNSINDTQQWLIVVGRPGTTEIDYSPDGTSWQPMDVENGIAVMKITTSTGFPPADSQVRLSDADGVYATGAPAGSGVDPNPTDSPTPSGLSTPSASETPSSLSTPTPTPTNS